MQYMLLIYENFEGLKQFNGAEKERVLADGLRQHQEWTQAMVKSGNYRASGGLGMPSTSTTLRPKDGKIVTTDGPFVESKEALGGYYVVECKDLDEALALAKKCPSLSWGGSVEVRPINHGR